MGTDFSAALINSGSQGISYTTPPLRPDRWAHRRAEPRPFALLWIIFLMGSTAIAFASTGAGRTYAPETFRLAMRVLLMMTALGVSIFWPLVRLSQARPHEPRTSVLLDLLVLIPPTQCVIWPQLLPWMGRWTFSVIGLVALSTLAWSFLTGAVLAIALRLEPPDAAHAAAQRISRRALAMLAFLALSLAGPAVAASVPSAGSVDVPMLASLPGFILDLVRDRSWTGVPAKVTAAHLVATALTAGVALLLWLIAFRLPEGRMAPSPEQA